MTVNVTIPKLGLNVDEVNLVEWKVQEGGRVEEGGLVLVIETQKTEWNIEAAATGFLHILVDEGNTAPVGGIVGIIADTRESYEEIPKGESAPARAAAPPGWKAEEVAASGPSEAGMPAPLEGRTRITPVARKMAESHMIDITGVTGTGPGGRIRREDIEAVLEAKKGIVPNAKEPAARPGEKRIYQTVPLKGMRKKIAEHMYRSLSSSAQMTIMGELDMTETTRLRSALVQEESSIGTRISFVDILLFVVSRALAEHRDMNCSITEGGIVLWEDINVGLAVALGKEGLIVPVIKNADKKSLLEIAREARRLSEGVQAGTLPPDEFVGGTFTLTSLGRKGVSLFQTPILNEPEAAILATGSITDRPVVRDGAIAIAPIMTYGLTFDHRAINGFGAEMFMGSIARLLRNPGLLLF